MTTSMRNDQGDRNAPFDGEPNPTSRALSREFTRQLNRLVSQEKYPLKHLREGEMLWQYGSKTRYIPYVETGKLEAVLRPGNGANQVVPVTFMAGEFAALSLLFSRQAVQFDLIAAEDSDCRWIPVETIEEKVLGDHQTLACLARLLACRLRSAQLRERAWLEKGVHERLCATLMRIAEHETEHHPGSPQLLKATHEQLAMRCGISRAKTSHELKMLESAGALRLKRGSIEILNASILRDG